MKSLGILPDLSSRIICGARTLMERTIHRQGPPEEHERHLQQPILRRRWLQANPDADDKGGSTNKWTFPWCPGSSGCDLWGVSRKSRPADTELSRVVSNYLPCLPAEFFLRWKWRTRPRSQTPDIRSKKSLGQCDTSCRLTLPLTRCERCSGVNASGQSCLVRPRGGQWHSPPTLDIWLSSVPPSHSPHPPQEQTFFNKRLICVYSPPTGRGCSWRLTRG